MNRDAAVASFHQDHLAGDDAAWDANVSVDRPKIILNLGDRPIGLNCP
jgi:hypothetical protein